MSSVSRRAALGILGVGAVGVTGLVYDYVNDDVPTDDVPPTRATSRTGKNPVVTENARVGTRAWQIETEETRAANDRDGQIQGYASTTSAAAGDSVAFHVSVRSAQEFTVTVHRIGHYGGQGGREVAQSPSLRGVAHPVPEAHPEHGMIDCGWPVSWTLDIPESWVSGVYLAVFTTKDGHRSSTPFIVREAERASDILVVLPFTTYQAYNAWPQDGRIGKNLYKGFNAQGKNGGNAERAFKVSFDRPYSDGGHPLWFEMDSSFARWAEMSGYDVTYASSLDLHEGTVDPTRYATVVFPGHDEYWSRQMRDVAEKAVASRTHLAYLGANNIYFHIRMEKSPAGTENRVVACYKQDPDPTPDEHGPTVRWRDLEKKRKHSEQRLLGVQYNGMLAKPVPLVVRRSDHWLWKGTGLADGDEIPNLIGIEADGRDRKTKLPRKAVQQLLSHSPYPDSMGRGERIQNTSLVQHRDGTMIFVAGTFFWPLALSSPDHLDSRIETATVNLLDRMLTRTVRA
ncbi:N,N-dimethylformamidase beta subunit family domain-containing protein [Streptomyces rubiginosohelvolus]|uniref:N,N-dimethylformamidase beta subunit family domain-containing protein n=1 Tax=Streptomyces rubiginosohelvolus TaxID=67362 RepID=UPI00381ADBBF